MPRVPRVPGVPGVPRVPRVLRCSVKIIFVAVLLVASHSAGAQPGLLKVQIRDGQWSTRVILEKGVDQANAELIVRAFHRGTIVDRRLQRNGAGPAEPPAPEEANRIASIERTSRELYGQVKDTYFDPSAYADLLRADGLYRVGISSPGGNSGIEYLVGVRAGKVELFLSSFWIV